MTGAAVFGLVTVGLWAVLILAGCSLLDKRAARKRPRASRLLYLGHNGGGALRGLGDARTGTAVSTPGTASPPPYDVERAA